jgi:hypothetical protein
MVTVHPLSNNMYQRLECARRMNAGILECGRALRLGYLQFAVVLDKKSSHAHQQHMSRREKI